MLERNKNEVLDATPRTTPRHIPAKVLPEIALELRPDVILVSHESMDHFDAPLCLTLLKRGRTVLVGSWGVMAALTECLPAGDPRPVMRVSIPTLQNSQPRWASKAPNLHAHGLEVDLQITNRCPLRCDHCVYDSRMSEPDGLAFALIQRLATEFEALGVAQVSITGGEPLLRKDLVNIVRVLSARSIEVCVQTSGLFGDRMDFGALRASGVSLLLVSVDGPEEYHDEFRRRSGSFSEARGTIAAARGHGLPVRVNTVVTRSNVDRVLELLEFSAALDVEVHSFFYFSPVGRGAEHAEEVLSFARWQRFTESVRSWCGDASRPRPQTVKLQNVALHSQNVPPGGQHCRIRDRDNILILASGDVYPCVFVCHRKELCLGNVCERSLTEIWTGSPAWTAAYEPFFRGSGKDCNGAIGHCSGGCPALRDLLREPSKHCDRRCEWGSTGLVPGCAREYQRVTESIAS